LLKKLLKGNICAITLLFLCVIIISIFPGCRNYDDKFDVVYFFKTEPEKAVLDFFQSLSNKDPDYIYTNLLLEKDKNSISREKYSEELYKILAGVEKIEVTSTVYLGYENETSKVVVEFEVSYKSGEIKDYKKYIYLAEENGKWKIIYEKTFI